MQHTLEEIQSYIIVLSSLIGHAIVMLLSHVQPHMTRLEMGHGSSWQPLLMSLIGLQHQRCTRHREQVFLQIKISNTE